MSERRNSYPFSFKWKAVFGLITFSVITSLVTLLVGGGKAWQKWDAMQLQLSSIQGQYEKQIKINGQFRGRIAELTTAVNDARSKLGLPPIIHQAILDGEPAVYILPPKTEIRAPRP